MAMFSLGLRFTICANHLTHIFHAIFQALYDYVLLEFTRDAAIIEWRFLICVHLGIEMAMEAT